MVKLAIDKGGPSLENLQYILISGYTIKSNWQALGMGEAIKPSLLTETQFLYLCPMPCATWSCGPLFLQFIFAILQQLK